ncbi:uncharacterized protein LOC116433392 isoform X1 [Nomia melanderi]|uniref:uncharacterized protein LOC116433392 isoform X1 n=1 Tax=Nomia melanderi TaxID=2448451 RepID=UPI003FCD7084
MGKTPKKAAPGGDERNLYNRRLLKATTAASKTSETHSRKRQRESENPNRPKLSSTQKKLPSGQGKAFKTKLCVPTKLDQSHPMKKVGRPVGSTKKGAFASKSAEAKSSKMQPESEEAETKLDRTVENKTPKQETPKETDNSLEKHVDHAPAEPVQVTKEEQQAGKELVTEKEAAETERKDETDSAESKEVEEQDETEENDLKLSLEADDSPVKVRDDKPSEEEPPSKESQDSQVRIESESSQEKKEDNTPNINDSQNDMESSSLDVPESPRSELSEVSETTSQNDTRNEKDKDEESTDDKEQSFVSYDPAIMLKDVQIKLNDCMKESSSKACEASSAEPARERESEADREQDREEMSSRPYQDLSFGKTLRGISGRRSLSRMRHVTIREHRYSPNNSMFVNMSSASLMPDDNEDFKILRYSTGLSDTVSTSNGSPTEKKRKYEASEDWTSATKKQKTNESDNSLLNSSLGLLKGLRRPIQVSTPVSELKFQTNKLDLSDEENKPINDRAKKWCAIM